MSEQEPAGPTQQPVEGPPPQMAVRSSAPGRYQTSFGGLVGAMIILVIGVLAFVGYRAVFRTEPVFVPEAVDQAETAQFIAESGLPVVVPSPLPDGWIATSAEVEPGANPVWRVGMLTDEQRFVGLRQADLSAESLLAQAYPDDDPVAADALTVPGAVVEGWDGWVMGEDDDADLAFTGEWEGQTLLVHGSAGADDLTEVIEALVEER